MALPGWSYRTWQVPDPLVRVNIPPEFVHEPALLKATGRPELLFAATLKAVLYAPLAGACTVTVIVWGIGGEACVAARGTGGEKTRSDEREPVTLQPPHAPSV